MSSGVTPLGELVRIARGTTYKSSRLGEPGPVLLGLASIHRDGGFRDDALKTYGGDSPDKLLVKPGELYASLKDVTQTGDLLGSVARLPIDGPTGRLTQDTVRLDVTSGAVSPDYLYLALLAPEYRDYCRRYATGTTTLGLPRDDFLAYPVRLPPLPEQRRIAGVLGAFDDLIETNRGLVSDLWAVADAAYQRAAAGGSYVALGEAIGLAYGKSLPAARRIPGSVSVVSSAGIVGTHSRKLVDGPGVVVGRKGTVGSVTWVFDDFYPIDTAFYAVSTLPMGYVYFLLRHAGLESMNTDSAVPGLNRNNALARRVSVPGQPLLDAFSRLADPCLGAIRSLEYEIAELTRARDELLPLLMSGRVRVRERVA